MYGYSISHDGSMVLLYMVCHGSHQYTPFMLAYIPAPWIRHGICSMVLEYLPTFARTKSPNDSDDLVVFVDWIFNP